MSELGALLREAREAKGLDLADAAADTHIRRTHLEAIEEGRRQDLPDAVYLRGLVASYGRYLGVDPIELRLEMDKEFGGRARAGGRVDSHQPLSEPLRGGAGIAIGLLVLALVVLAVATWWFWPSLSEWSGSLWSRASRPEGQVHTATATRPIPTATLLPAGVPAEATETPEPTDKPEPTALTAPTSAALPLPTPGPTNTPVPVIVTPAPTPSPTIEPGVRLVVRAESPAWLRVTADGVTIYEGTLVAGDEQAWFGVESVELLTGNAGGTAIFVNGVEVERLGGPGDVETARWVWDGQQAIQQ